MPVQEYFLLCPENMYGNAAKPAQMPAEPPQQPPLPPPPSPPPGLPLVELSGADFGQPFGHKAKWRRHSLLLAPARVPLTFKNLHSGAEAQQATDISPCPIACRANSFKYELRVFSPSSNSFYSFYICHSLTLHVRPVRAGDLGDTGVFTCFLSSGKTKAQKAGKRQLRMP